jgi:hypothetical protein
MGYGWGPVLVGGRLWRWKMWRENGMIPEQAVDLTG